MRKILVFIMLMFLFITNTYAYTFKGGDVIKNMFIVKIKENGEKEYKKGQFIIDESGDYVYCLEPFVKVKNGATYNEYESDFAKKLGISNELWQKLNLIAYYGYGYKSDIHNHTDPKWYYITQVLIWKEVSPKSNFYFTNTFEGSINSTLFISEIEEIYNLVNNHFIIPEFSFPEAYKNDTITVIDQKGVLKNYKTNNSNVSINGNILTIKLTDNNNFTLYKGTNAKQIIYVSNNSQNILKGSMEIPVTASYNIEAKEVTGKITLKKYGEIYSDNTYINKPLKDVYFILSDEYDVYLQEKKTDENGIIVFDNLKPGTYYIRETEKLDGYLKNDKVYKVEINLNENNRAIDVSKDVYNTLEKGSLILKKIDTDTKLPIKDTIFRIYNENTLIYEGKTNDDGIIKLVDIPLGTYKIMEFMPSNGYKINEHVIEVNLDKEEVKTIVIENELEKGSLIIKKIDFDTKEPINDVLFHIYLNDTFIKEVRTSDSGIIELNDLVLGTYKIVEQEPKAGYKKNELVVEVTINKDMEVKEVVIENEKLRGSIIIKKYDANTKELLPNTTFQIIKDGEVIEESTTDINGVIRVDNLVLGTYLIKEVNASDGYVLNTTDTLVNLDDDEIEVEIFNIPDTNINIYNIIYFWDKDKDRLKRSILFK